MSHNGGTRRSASRPQFVGTGLIPCCHVVGTVHQLERALLFRPSNRQMFNLNRCPILRSPSARLAMSTFSAWLAPKVAGESEDEQNREHEPEQSAADLTSSTP